jgi:uncharacterized membrane protein
VLFLLAATGLLIPVVHSGKYALLTWATNGLGLVLAVSLVAIEWVGRSPQAEAGVNLARSDVNAS